MLLLISTFISHWLINFLPSNSSHGIKTPLAKTISERPLFPSRTGFRIRREGVSMPGKPLKSVYPISHIPPPNDSDRQPFDVPLVSTRGSTGSQGFVNVKLGFVRPQNTQLFMEFPDIYSEIATRSSLSIVSAPPVRPSSRSYPFRFLLITPFRPRVLAQFVPTPFPLISRGVSLQMKRSTRMRTSRHRSKVLCL